MLKKKLRVARDSIVEYLNNYSDPVYLQWYFNESKRLLKFKKINKKEDCFIIGNGPSLNKIDLSLLNNYYTFGLNKIYLIFDKVNLNISYHVAVNHLVVEQSAREFENLNCPSFLSARAADNVVDKRDHIYKIFTAGSPFVFQTDASKLICEGYTVTYVAMQLAFYMGFKRIFLIGVDHNFTAVGNPNEKQFLKGDDPNHFTPGYFGNKEWHLPDLEGSELAYHMARFNFNRSGREIYDATVDGKLQIFPKITFEQALDMCKKKVVVKM
ncbi:6-hydroxymethylpterin diphosphokinase MptE-like protein [Moorena producens]|uniref:6-hydroxymethylpterin diphosphokinase MptE-like protein n=1 Tax=Moorena producens TaxID=1155739 RepID=UPI000B33CA51|nr:6-hydroxymethylpterin diphosphokinase MptE-like protein [Moorena producens]